MNKAAYRVETPTALIGVRGTDLIVIVNDDQSTTVIVLRGSVEVIAKQSQQSKLVSKSTSVLIYSGWNIDDIDYAVPPDPGLDTGLNPGATANDGGEQGGGGH